MDLNYNARILKAHSYSMSGSSIWASLECQCCFWIAGRLGSYLLTMWLLTLQLFKNSIGTQGKLRLNFHSLSVSELLEYGRKTPKNLNHQTYNLYLNLTWLSNRTAPTFGKSSYKQVRDWYKLAWKPGWLVFWILRTWRNTVFWLAKRHELLISLES
jgi:hypothetical protein